VPHSHPAYLHHAPDEHLLRDVTEQGLCIKMALSEDLPRRPLIARKAQREHPVA